MSEDYSHLTFLKQKDLKSFRESLLREQGGKCLVSGRTSDRMALDHAHIRRLKLSGMIRGVLDANINVYVGKIENSASRCGINQKEIPNLLRSIADYLERPDTNVIHPSEIKHFKPVELIQKSEYNKIVKHAKVLFPRMKKIPPYPKNKKMTVKLKSMLEKTIEHIDSLKPKPRTRTKRRSRRRSKVK